MKTPAFSFVMKHLLGCTIGTGICVIACSGPSGNEVFVSDPPPFTTFPEVNDALELHCGTLDCHGSSARNFRIYGIDGLRLARTDVPGGNATSADEYEATYQSIISLQPEVLSEIVSQHGAHPERFIVITKGRGTEHHKGGTRMTAGDALDVCLTSWLAGATNSDACATAAAVTPPGGEGF
jgi:hypothetical protein